jgi:hypothetical protein
MSNDNTIGTHAFQTASGAVQYHLMGIVDPDSLAKQVTEDIMAWRTKEAEKMRASLHSLQEELEDEKHFRKHSETLHRKLGKESSDPKFCACDCSPPWSTQMSVKESYEMKSSFARDLEKEKKMQSDDVRTESAGRMSITEQLSSEIQSFLPHAKRPRKSKYDNLHIINEKRDPSWCRQSLVPVLLCGATSAPRLAEDDDGSSVARDLHCFELNMHGSAIRNHELCASGCNPNIFTLASFLSVCTTQAELLSRVQHHSLVVNREKEPEVSHMTLLFSEDFFCQLESPSKKLCSEATVAQYQAAMRLLGASQQVNHIISDALSGLLLVEAIWQYMGWSFQYKSHVQWDPGIAAAYCANFTRRVNFHMSHTCNGLLILPI